MAGVLERAQLRQHDAVAEVDVGAGRVDAELEPQRAPLGELLGQPALGQRVDRAGEQVPSVAASSAAPAGASRGQC